MAIESTIPRSRRALLAASLGGLAAFAAGALGRPSPVRAADVVLGATNAATTTTTIQNTTNGNTVFQGWSLGGGDGVVGISSSGVGVYGTSSTGIGVEAFTSAGSAAAIKARAGNHATAVYGYSGVDTLPATPTKTGVYGYATQDTKAVGVRGESPLGTGVWGGSVDGFGVYGTSTSGTGVFGSGSAYGCYGRSQTVASAGTVGLAYGGGTGVLGVSGRGDVPAAPAKTGVYGYAVQDGTSRGVWGRTTAGRGVNGQATSGRGVHGYASSGVGVYAACGSSGRAFQAAGRVEFSTSGLAPIAAAASSVAVTPGVDLTGGSRILCTLEGNPGSGVMVQRVVKNTTSDTFTVYLNKATVSAAQVAWFVIG